MLRFWPGLIDWLRCARWPRSQGPWVAFSHELISAVAGMPERQLSCPLEQLVTAELIFQRGTPPDADYTFKHALVQDAAYSTLLKTRRQQSHGRVVAGLEERFPEIVSAQPALLAHHCVEQD
jgi:predicted ATPase